MNFQDYYVVSLTYSMLMQYLDMEMTNRRKPGSIGIKEEHYTNSKRISNED